MSDQKLKFQGYLKIPGKPFGKASVSKMVRPEGCESDDPRDWDIADEQNVDNLILDQAKNLYGGYNTTWYGSQSNRMAFGMNSWMWKIKLSDDATTPDATNTTVAGTEVWEPSVYFNNVDVVADAGEHQPTDHPGVMYTALTREGALYDSNVPAGTTFSKVYATQNIYWGHTDPVIENGQGGQLQAGEPIAEVLLNSSVTIDDPDNEALYVRYTTYWPRLGNALDGSKGQVQIGSGSFDIKNKNYDGTMAADGPTVNWTMQFEAHHNPDIYTDTTLNYQTVMPMPNLDVTTAIDPNEANGNFGIAESSTGGKTYDEPPESGKPAVSASVTTSKPTAQSRKFVYQTTQKNWGDLNTDRLVQSIAIGPNDRYSVFCWIEFDQQITINWNETLEIHAEFTIDWS